MLNLNDDKRAKIVEYIRSLKTLEDAMEPYKEQKRELRKDFKDQGWLNQTEQRLATKAYRLMKSEIDLDELYDVLFIKSSKKLGLFLWKFCDGTIIDGFGPDGISSFIKKCSIKATKFQSGFIYQYAFVMLLGFSALLTFLIVK